MRDGQAVRDIVGFAEEPAVGEGVQLLREAMRRGASIDDAPSLAAVQERCSRLLAELPDYVTNLDSTALYPVEPSAAMAAAMAQ